MPGDRRASLMAGSSVKNRPAIQETQKTLVRSLGQKDPLEEEMATHSSILAWKTPLIEGWQSKGSESDTTEWISRGDSMRVDWMYESESHLVCPTLCDPMDYTVYGILQARILKWVAFPFSRRSSQPRDRTQVPCIAGGFFTSWATRNECCGYCC